VAELSLAIKPNPLGGGSLLVNATQTALLADCGCCKFEPICCCGKFTPVTFTLDFSVTTRFDVTTELSGTIACTQKSACVWTGSIDGSALQPDFGPGTTISNAKFVGTATCNNMPRVDWVGDVSGLPGGDTTVTLNLIGQGIDSGILFSNVPGPVTWIDSFDCDNPLSTGHTLCSGSVTITASADGIDCPDTSCATCPLVLSLTITLGDISLCFKVPKDLFFDCVWFRAGTGQGSTGDGWTIRLDKELDDTGDPIWVLDVDSSHQRAAGSLHGARRRLREIRHVHRMPVAGRSTATRSRTRRRSRFMSTMIARRRGNDHTLRLPARLLALLRSLCDRVFGNVLGAGYACHAQLHANQLLLVAIGHGRHAALYRQEVDHHGEPGRRNVPLRSGR
jgi:hypothetical protein